MKHIVKIIRRVITGPFVLTGMVISTLIGTALSGCQSNDQVPEKPAITLQVLECGYGEAQDKDLFSDDGAYKGQKWEFVSPCYLITHPTKGKLLWDAGLSDSLKENPVTTGPFHLWVVNTLMSQLNAAGLSPADIKYLAFSHMHIDHTGNANAFAGSTWLTPEAEYNEAWKLVDGKPLESYAHRWAYDKLINSKTIKFTGDYDVFGDGSVVMMAAPGHTPGEQYLFVDLPKTGPVVLSGDVYHMTLNRTYRRVPRFNTSRLDSIASMDRIEDFIKAKNATLIIQHEIADYQKYPKFPNALH